MAVYSGVYAVLRYQFDNDFEHQDVRQVTFRRMRLRIIAKLSFSRQDPQHR